MIDVSRLTYKPGWTFKIAGPGNRFLCIYATTTDSQRVDRKRTTQHQFEIPTDLDGDHAAARWVFDCLLLCEQHETGEFLQVDGQRPFFPNHQDEGSPYDLVDRWDLMTWH